jgi:hypothetical protein
MNLAGGMLAVTGALRSKSEGKRNQANAGAAAIVSFFSNRRAANLHAAGVECSETGNEEGAIENYNKAERPGTRGV